MSDIITCPSCAEDLPAGDPPPGDPELIFVACPGCNVESTLADWERAFAKRLKEHEKEAARNRKEAEEERRRRDADLRRAELAKAAAELTKAAAEEAKRTAAIAAQRKAVAAAPKPPNAHASRGNLRGNVAWAGRFIETLGVIMMICSGALLALWILAVVFSMGLAIFALPAAIAGAAGLFVSGVLYCAVGGLCTSAMRTATATEDMLALMTQVRAERLAEAGMDHPPTA